MNVRSFVGIMLTFAIFGLSTPSEARLENVKPGVPEPGTTIAPNLVLVFSQRVNAKTSRVQIRNSHGAYVDIGQLKASATGTDLEIPLNLSVVE